MIPGWRRLFRLLIVIVLLGVVAAVPAVRGALLRALGVANVEVIAHPAGGTEEESEVLVAWCDRRRLQSILVLSSPDHSRRVRRALRRSMRGRQTRVIVRAARYSAFDPDRWWT